MPLLKTKQQISGTILEIEQDLASGLPQQFLMAKEKADSLRSSLPSLDDEDTTLAVAILTACGHAERALENLTEADTAYEEALAVLDGIGEADETSAKRSANLWTYRGLALLSMPTEEAWKQAIDCFDRSIELREKEPERNASTDWGLSAAFMNRADGLSKLGGETKLEKALADLERALEILKPFEKEENPGFRSRIALAWMNRGNLYARLSLDYSENLRDESLAAYDHAVEVLRPGAASGIPESERMLCVALSNRSRARVQLLGPDGAEVAQRDAHEVLSLVKVEELDDPEMVLLFLTTRITLCHILDGAKEDESKDSAITDIAEEGLQQVSFHQAAIIGENDILLGQLFRCGAIAYLRSSPQFLTEYLLDFLDPEKSENAFPASPACHEAAVEVLWQGISKLQGDGFGSGDALEKKLDRIQEWQDCRQRLTAIRSRYFSLEEESGDGS